MSTKKSQRHYDNLHTFIYRLLKKYDSSANMTVECKDIINQLMRDLSIRYVIGCVALCRHAKKVTIDSNAVEALTKIWLNNTEPLDFAHDIWEKYSQNNTKGIGKHIKAGLCLPPARFKDIFREYRGVDQQIGEPAYIFLTAIMEYIFGAILQKAILLAKQDNKITITGAHVFQAINSSTLSYFAPLFNNSFVAGFGYIGNNLLYDAQYRYLSRT